MTEGSGELWGGRFSGVPAPEAQALGRSLEVDAQLVSEDVQAGIAHVGALRDAGWLTDDDVRRLTEALERVRDAILAGTFAFDPADEDIHSAVERGVTDLLGDLGAKLHAGRSRNDLVATDVRLHLLDRPGDGERRRARSSAACSSNVHARMPPTRCPDRPTSGPRNRSRSGTISARTRGRWLATWSGSPTGGAARPSRRSARGRLATSTLGLDPVATAERLGFDRAFDNSLDAVSDRDVLQECVAVAAICATHLSRLAADLLRWTDPALGWAELDDAYSTGSSMMPQKRNPDTAELARAKAAADHGRLRDARRDAPGVAARLPARPAGGQGARVRRDRPRSSGSPRRCAARSRRCGSTRRRCGRRARDPGLYATDVAEALVKTGVPFREAHRRTGELLKRLDADGRSLARRHPAGVGGVRRSGRRCVARPRRVDRGASRSRRPVAASVVRQCDALDAILGPQPP